MLWVLMNVGEETLRSLVLTLRIVPTNTLEEIVYRYIRGSSMILVLTRFSIAWALSPASRLQGTNGMNLIPQSHWPPPTHSGGYSMELTSHTELMLCYSLAAAR